MAPLKSTPLAWAIAIASFTLWASSAPLSWGQAATSADRLFDQSMDETTTTTTTSTTISTTSTSAPETATTTDDAAGLSPACPSPPAALTPPVVPAPPVADAAQQGSFHLCGADAQAAHAIEQLIAGRSFNAMLSARGDGCADLSIRVTSAGIASGSASSNLSVSLGSGQPLSIQITSDAGATHVNIGQGR